MKRSLLAAAVIAVAAWSAAVRAEDTVAITEFIVSPIGEQDSRQWIELFNYGPAPIDITNFMLTDGKNDVCKIPKATINSGDFVVIVLCHEFRRYEDERKKVFEAEWLGGKEDPRVVPADRRFTLSRSDTVILQNRARQTLWTIGYKGDDRAGNSTYLAVDNFDITIYGTAEDPMINRNGNDGQTLGYEGQFATKEAVAWTSDVSKLESIGGIVYQSKANGGGNEPAVGSPLKGAYTVKK